MRISRKHTETVVSHASVEVTFEHSLALTQEVNTLLEIMDNALARLPKVVEGRGNAFDALRWELQDNWEWMLVTDEDWQITMALAQKAEKIEQ